MPESSGAVDDARSASERRRRCPIRRRRTCSCPKWLTARARAASGERGHKLRSASSRVFGVGFWGFIFVHAVPAARVLPRRAGDRAAARRQAARPHSGRILLDPAAVEHHHRAVELFSRARSRSARVRAGRLAEAVSGQAARDARALELDGGADGGADVRGVRRRLRRRAAVSARSCSRRSCRFSSCRR